MEAPPHSLQRYLILLCMQKLDPTHSLHCAFLFPWLQNESGLHSLHCCFCFPWGHLRGCFSEPPLSWGIGALLRAGSSTLCWEGTSLPCPDKALPEVFLRFVLAEHSSRCFLEPPLSWEIGALLRAGSATHCWEEISQPSLGAGSSTLCWEGMSLPCPDKALSEVFLRFVLAEHSSQSPLIFSWMHVHSLHKSFLF